MKPITLMRFKDISSRLPLSRRTLNRRIDDGLWTKPVRISDNLIAWPSDEVDLLIAVRVEGKSNSQIMSLVKRLEIDRQYLLQDRPWVLYGESINGSYNDE